jgi:hypothetical protein
VCVRIVTPTEYARVGQIVREEVAQPVDTVGCCPRLLAMSVQAMDGDDARDRSAKGRDQKKNKPSRRTQPPVWCPQTPLANHGGLYQLAPLGRMRKIDREPG